MQSVVHVFFVVILALHPTDAPTAPLGQILTVEMTQMFREVILSQKPELAFTSALLESAVHPVHLAFVVHALLVALQVRLAGEALVAGKAGRCNTFADVLLVLGRLAAGGCFGLAGGGWLPACDDAGMLVLVNVCVRGRESIGQQEKMARCEVK